MCPICVATKPLMKNWDTWKEWPYRSEYKAGEKNISRSPLMPNITSSDIVVPITHLLTGLTKKGMVVLEKKILGEAVEWDDEKEEQLEDAAKKLRHTTEGLRSTREFRKTVIEISTLLVSLTKQPQKPTIDACSPYCLYPTLSLNRSLDFDLIPCERCDKSNHVLCTHTWDPESYKVAASDRFICLHCAGCTVDDLVARDKACIEQLDAQETEYLELTMENEQNWTELTHEHSRSSTKLIEALKQMRIQSGVYPRYYYNDLVGDDARRLTLPENAERLWGLVDEEEVRSFGVALFDTLHQLFKLLSTDFKTVEQIRSFGYYVERIQMIWSSIHPEETVTPKMHCLTHLREAMMREGHAGREIETIEHVHRSLNVLWPKYATVQPLSHRLFIIVARFNSRNSLTY